MKRSTKAWLLAAALAWALVCCRGQKITVEPTGAEIIARKDLSGEWYYMVTTVEVAGTTSLTFPGETGRDMPVIEWDIQQDALYARLAHPFVGNIPGRWSDTRHVGQVVGAWPIKGHLNADGSHCFWQECSHIQVDWSQSLNVDLEVLWQRALGASNVPAGFGDAVFLPDARVHRDDTGRVTYLDAVEQVLLSPRDGQDAQTSETSDCYRFWGTHDCGEAKAVLRHAFLKRQQDPEYQPSKEYNYRSSDLGFFTSPPAGHPSTFGGPWYANRFNLWQTSYAVAGSPFEAQRFAAAQCPEPAPGESFFYCPGAGKPCRCTVGDRKVYVLAEEAYEYDDVDRASTESEARIHARGQCPAGAATCTPTECHCTTTSEPVYRLGYDVQSIPVELTEKDGVFCPCDGQNLDTCTGSCFYKSDGTTVYFAHSNGSHRYPLRYFQRQLRQIPYYLSKDFPDSLRPSAEKVLRIWSDVLDDTVFRVSGCEMAGLIRGADPCSARPEFTGDATGGSRYATLVLCPNNPVLEGDPDACGPPGTEVETGDIRFSQFVYWHTPNAYAPLSYGPFGSDPTTGEILSASVHYYDAVAEPVVQRNGAIVRILTDEDFAWIDWMFGRWPDRTESRRAAGPNLMPGPSVGARTLPPKTARQAFDRMELTPKRNHKRSDPHATRLRNTAVEDSMMTNAVLRNRTPTLLTAGLAVEDVLSLTGQDLPYGTDLRHQVSPITWLDTDHLRRLGQLKFGHFANTVMHAEFMPFSFSGGYMAPATPFGLSGALWAAREMVHALCADDRQLTLTEIWAQIPDCGQKVLEGLRTRTYEHVAAHQMGHNVGLRHNFKASFDVLNYDDPYWDIRVAGVMNRGDTQLQQRHLQPVSEWEHDQGIVEYKRTSLMDFGSPFFKSELRPGRWDVASVNRAYGEFVQVFDQLRDDSFHVFQTVGLVQAFRSFGWPTPLWFWSTGPEAVLLTLLFWDPDHPTVTPEGVVDLREHNRRFRPEAWLSTFEVAGEPVSYTRPELEPDGESKLMVPYLHCPEANRNIEPGCHYFDTGADLFEIAESLIAGHRSHRYTRNVSPHRFGEPWDEDGYTFSIFHRYFDTLQSLAGTHAAYWTVMTRQWYRDIPDEIDRFFTEDWASYTIAVARSVDLFAGLLSMPPSGILILQTAPDGTQVWRWVASLEYAGPGDIVVDLLGSSWGQDQWTTDPDFRWRLKRIHIGQSSDRTLAVQMLSEHKFVQIADEAVVSGVGYPTLYRACLLAYLGGILSYDWSAFAPRVCLRQGLPPGSQNQYFEPVDICGVGTPPCQQLQAQIREQEDDPTITLVWANQYLDPGITYEQKVNMLAFGAELIPPMYGIYPAQTADSSPFTGCNDLDLDGCLTVTFTDPLSHRTYVALRHPDEERPGALLDVSIGAKMLEYARLLKRNLEAAEAACPTPCEPGDAGYDAYFNARADLEAYLLHLDLMETLTRTQEQGP